MCCVPNVAVASTGNYPTTIYNNARHTDDYISMARGSTSNGILKWYSVTEGIVPSSAISNGIIYVGSGDHNVYALDARTGAKVWNYTTGNRLSFWSAPPTVTNGIVYLGCWDHNVYALDANTGAKIWSYETGNFVFSSPTVSNGVVYVGSLDHNVYALDANTGAMIWKFTTGAEINSSPAVAYEIK
jgi:outer membrane protein assembly factor BamB